MEIFLAITREQSIILLFVLSYVFVDRVRSVQALSLMLFTMTYNHWLKSLFQMPLPSALTLSGVEGWAFPSGHMHTATVFVGYLAWSVRNRLALGVGAFLLTGVGVALVSKGFHYPADVFGAFAFGTLSIAVADYAARKELVLDNPWVFPVAALALQSVILMAVLLVGHVAPALWLAVGGATGLALGALSLRRSRWFAGEQQLHWMAQGIALVLTLGGVALILTFLRGPLGALLPSSAATAVLYFVLGLWLVAIPAALAAQVRK